MKRRTAVRNLVILTAGAGLLPSCVSSTSESTIHLKNIPLSGAQENMLAELSEAIIPRTGSFAGAKDLKAHEFLLTMVDECASPEDQKVFTNSMEAFDDRCQKKFSAAFPKFSPQQKNELLTELEKSNPEQDSAAKFYKIVKQYTLQCFTSSKQYLVDVRKWKLVPGPDFKGCVPVKS